MNQQTVTLLLSIANELDKAARQCNIAKIWLRSNYCPGLAIKARVEAKERWRYSNMIHDRIIDRGGVVTAIPAVPAMPAAGTGWTTESVFGLLARADQAVLVLIENCITRLAKTPDYVTMAFVVGVQEKFWKDVNEIKEIVDQTGQAVPSGLLILDNKYLKMYEE